MSLTKMIILFAVIGFLLLFILIIYFLSAATRDVSTNPALRKFINRPLALKRAACIRNNGNGFYYFTENILQEDGEGSGELILRLPPGAKIILHKFKTSRNKMSTGDTCLLALGEVQNLKSRNIAFEYWMGNVNGSLPSPDSNDLSHALWQDGSEPKIEFLND